MRWLRFGVVALVATSAGLGTSIAPAAAAQPSSIIVSGHICNGLENICPGDNAMITGSGQDVKIIQFNQCSGQGTICTNELTLAGTFGKVVLLRSNACSDGATCSNIVHIEGTVEILQTKESIVTFDEIKIKNRCDATATCSNAPE